MWKLHALMYSFLIPNEFSISLGSLNLSTYRILLLLIFPWLLYQLILKRNFKWRLLDTIALLVCIWPSIALTINSSISTAIESGGILFLEYSVPFFAARQLVYKHRQLVSLSKTLLIIAFIMAITAIPEAITGTPFVHSISSLITGNSFSHVSELRFGITRAYGPTDHPIILGSICAAAIPLGFALARRSKLFATMTSISTLGVVASASSGPLLSVLVQAFLFLWSRLAKGIRNKWWLLIISIACVYITIDLLSNRDPFRVMFSYLLFNEHNGYVRYNMWINSFYLTGQSIESFFIGYGFSTDMMQLLDNLFWTQLMSSSVDSYWLVILLRYGAPMLLLNFLLLFLVLRENTRNYRKLTKNSEKRLRLAWLITLTSLSLVAFTVHFWGSTASMFFIILGATGMSKKQLKTVSTTSLGLVNKTPSIFGKA